MRQSGRDGSGGGAIGGIAGARTEEKVAVSASAAPAPPMAAPRPEPGAVIPQIPGSAQTVAPSMLIRTGDARVEVDSLELAVERLRQLVQRVGGYIANTSMRAGQEQTREATLELKIPAARFDEAVGGLESIGEVKWSNVNAQDVGEEFVDMTARMQNAKRLEDRLLGLLASRTGRLDEVLAVERELARVREEIERYQGRLRFLSTRAAVSTLSVTVYEEGPLVGGPGGGILDAFRDAWRNFVGFIEGLIRAMGILVPLGGLLALAWIGARRFWPPRQTPPPSPGS
jgi:hypothetical protein